MKAKSSAFTQNITLTLAIGGSSTGGATRNHSHSSKHG